MKKQKAKQIFSRGCAALLSISIGLSTACLPDVLPAFAAVTASSDGYVSGATYSHNSRFAGYSIVNGIDVSSYQKTIDWNKVKADGIDYAFIRVGFRGYGDSGSLNADGKYAENLKNAVAAGVKVGVYIYSQAITTKEGIEEANFILNKIKGYDVTLPVVIDYEYAGTGLGRLYNAKLSKRKATDICAAFCKTVAAAGYTPMVYANKTMLETKMYASELSEKYPIWLAHYTTKTGYAGDYQYWQYSSKGRVNGITTGNVDCNFFYTTDSGYKNIKIDHQAADPSMIDAKITVNIQNPGGGIVSEVGFTLYDASGTELGSYYDSCGYSSSRVAYTASISDYGIVLNPLTTYYYLPYTKVGQNLYYGTRQSFTTTEPKLTFTGSASAQTDNVLITASVDNPAGSLIELFGCRIYDANGVCIGTYQEACNTSEKRPVFVFDAAAKMGITLDASTQYFYEFYAAHDGKLETSGRMNFTTAGNQYIDFIALDQSTLTLNDSNPTAVLTALWTPTDVQLNPSWATSDPSVVTVDSTGKVTAVGVGTATVVATAQGRTASCSVTVTSIKPTLTLDITQTQLAVDDTRQLIPSISPANPSAVYIWNSSDPTVASVDAKGWITGLKAGKTTVRCTLASNSKVYAECTVTVNQSFVYHLDGGTNSSDNPINAAAGETITLKAPTRAGYRFDGWYTDSGFTNRVTTVTAAQNQTVSLYAKWSKTTLKAPTIKQLYTKVGGKLYIYLTGKVSGAEGYQYVYSTSSKFTTYKTSTVTGTSRGVSVNLNTKYYVKVRAYWIDSTGKKVYGPYSAVQKAVTASVKPEALAGVKATTTTGKITVAVTKSALTSYGYQYVIATNSSFTENKQSVNTRNRSYTFENLPAGTYYVRGRTYNKDAVAGGNTYGAYTSTVKITVKSNTPGKLSGITLSSAESGSVTVAVDKAVTGCTGYQYVIADNQDFTDKKYVNSTKKSYTFTGLKDGTYYVKARAYIKNSSTGKNTYSSYTAVKTITLKAQQKPENLIGVTAESAAKGEMTVRVAQPVLSCYGYQYVIASNEAFTNAVSIDTRLRYYTFTELPKGTYYIKGRTYDQSISGEGNVYGDFCPTITFTVESDIPESLIGVTAESAAKGSLTVKVAQPVISCYGYQYEIAADENFTDAKTVDTRNRSYTFTGLTAGTYYVRGRTYDQSEGGNIYGVFCPVITIKIA